jgi:hypothetical protein
MKEDEMGRARGAHGEVINAFIMLVVRSERKRPLERPAWMGV